MTNIESLTFINVNIDDYGLANILDNCQKLNDLKLDCDNDGFEYLNKLSPKCLLIISLTTGGKNLKSLVIWGSR